MNTSFSPNKESIATDDQCNSGSIFRRPADSILQYLATCSNTWSSLTDVVIICKDGLLPAHKLVLAALSPLLCSMLGEADTWDETVSVLMPDFSIQQVSPYLADIFTCEDLGQHPEINSVFGHFVEEISPLVDIIDIKDECLTPLQTDSSQLADVETSPISQNGDSVELKRKPQDKMDSELQLKDNKRALGKKFQCPQCISSFTQKGSLQKHIKSIHEGRTFDCLHCDHKATRKDNLQDHIKSIHEGQKFPCPHCEYKAAWNSDLKKHIKSIHEGQKFPCPHCEYKATHKKHLQRHFRSVHEGQTYQCPQCEYKTNNERNFKQHTNIHILEKPFLCDKCGESFKTRTKLMRHLDYYLSHEDRKARRMKPFKCCHCNKLYRLKNSMETHKKECKKMPWIIRHLGITET